MTLCKTLGAALFATTLLTPALAQDASDTPPPDSFTLGGVEITTRDNADFEEELTANGEVLLTDGMILLNGTVEVAGQSVVTGIAGSGGNACDSTPFVVSVKEGKPAVDGPIDSCRWFEVTVQPEALVFHTDAFPGTPAEVWTWTPVSGLTEASPEEFTPKAGETWSDFDSLASAHPIDALGFAPVFAEVSAGMGAQDWADYTTVLSQLGSGDLVDKGYSGSACVKFDCERQWAWLWIDKDSRQAVALWMGENDEVPKSWPADRTTWPEWIQHAASDAVKGGG